MVNQSRRSRSTSTTLLQNGMKYTLSKVSLQDKFVLYSVMLFQGQDPRSLLSTTGVQIARVRQTIFLVSLSISSVTMNGVQQELGRTYLLKHYGF